MRIGLLSVETVPAGFVFTSDFTAGTKDEVSGRYSASCCLNKVDIIATDLNGNQDRTSIDINNSKFIRLEYPLIKYS